MPETRLPTIRLSDAAFAADVEIGRLRTWLRRDGVLGPAPDGRGWRRFSDADVAELAITRELVAWGVSPSLAWRTAHAIVGRVTWRFAASAPRSMLAEARAERRDRGLITHEMLDQVAVVRDSDPQGGLGISTTRLGGGDLIEQVRSLGYDSMIFLDPLKIVERALARLDAAVEADQ